MDVDMVPPSVVDTQLEDVSRPIVHLPSARATRTSTHTRILTTDSLPELIDFWGRPALEHAPSPTQPPSATFEIPIRSGPIDQQHLSQQQQQQQPMRWTNAQALAVRWPQGGDFSPDEPGFLDRRRQRIESMRQVQHLQSQLQQIQQLRTQHLTQLQQMRQNQLLRQQEEYDLLRLMQQGLTGSGRQQPSSATSSTSPAGGQYLSLPPLSLADLSSSPSSSSPTTLQHTDPSSSSIISLTPTALYLPLPPDLNRAFPCSSSSTSCPPHKPVYILSCSSCNLALSDRGMKASLLLRPNIALFSSDALPDNIGVLYLDGKDEDVWWKKGSTEKTAAAMVGGGGRAVRARTCDCLTQGMGCLGCGTVVGYHIVSPCERCTASDKRKSSNGHRFVFHSSAVKATHRLYTPSQPGVFNQILPLSSIVRLEPKAQILSPPSSSQSDLSSPTPDSKPTASFFIPSRPTRHLNHSPAPTRKSKSKPSSSSSSSSSPRTNSSSFPTPPIIYLPEGDLLPPSPDFSLPSGMGFKLRPGDIVSWSDLARASLHTHPRPTSGRERGGREDEEGAAAGSMGVGLASKRRKSEEGVAIDVVGGGEGSVGDLKAGSREMPRMMPGR